MLDVTVVEFSCGCLSSMKEILENFKLREYDTIRTVQSDQMIFRRRQMIVIQVQCKTANVAKMTT